MLESHAPAGTKAAGHTHDGGTNEHIGAAAPGAHAGVPDSIPGSTATTQTLTVGSSAAGTINPETDTDWFRITLTVGTTYVFTLDGTGASKLNDPYLYLYNGSGALISANDDGGPGLGSRIVFTPSASGTYYLGAAAYLDSNYDNVGQYTLSANIPGNAPVYSLAQIANYLTDGFWDGGGFHFSNHTITYNLSGLTDAAKPLARLALQSWEDVCDITFQETTDSANITFDDAESGAFANSDGNSARINVGADWMSRYGAATDSYTLQTFIHEIGHALGLGHAGPYNGTADYGIDNLYANDTWQYTVMSYFTQPNYGDGSFRFVMTPQLADIVAVHSLYGAATTTRTGDTIYGFNSNAGTMLSFSSYTTAPALTIYDSGGSDTLDCSDYGAAQVIDLTPGSFSSIGGLTGNIAIVTTTVIENAIGGAGNDRIIANNAINRLQGLGGGDTYIVNQALDTVSEAAERGNDTVISGVSYQLQAGAEVETLRTLGSDSTSIINLTGNEFGNTLVGNAAANQLNGGAGADRLLGFRGNDTFLIDSALDQVVESHGQGNDVAITRVSYALAAGAAVEVLRTYGTSTTGVVNLTGNEFNNTLVGNAAANVLNGRAGNDLLAGYGGSDVFAFDTTLNAATNVDFIADFSVLQDSIRLEDSIFTGLTAGALAAGAFRAGPAAADANDRIVYDSGTGALIFDSNGVGSGGETRFATLSTGLLLTSDDFVVI